MPGSLQDVAEGEGELSFSRAAVALMKLPAVIYINTVEHLALLANQRRQIKF